MSHKTASPFPRRRTRRIMIGRIAVGDGAAISVQSMTKTDTRDAAATAAQIRRLERAGCEVIRLAVPDIRAAEALRGLRAGTKTALVADIHFDHKLALAALEAGVDGLRLNPGNIGSRKKIEEVVKAARERSVPIRIGVNSGSLEKDLLEKYGRAVPEALAESALRHVRILEDLDFHLIKISLKASDIPRTLEAYRLVAGRVDYPFHAGITEAGLLLPGTVKSSAGLALLLNEGLADTIRVSLTAPPENEVDVGWTILRSMGIRRRGVELVSCPSCGRCEVDLPGIASAVAERLSGLPHDLTIAVMGCMVNGPGEAKEADIGLACGRGAGVVFKKGRIHRRLPEKNLVDGFVEDVLELAGQSPERGPGI
ncbi:MAG: flavodoxin-dependent (E)-4-hydroxy-3-methylbut-2-enyl-diphosphate synthase [Acidobacteriota bacterium]|nr:flavodoxin-dependent (E)-4-hydroxy-3-methylbut-2-enyl-diphosphate synthase [Acidobacteriota bacterium]